MSERDDEAPGFDFASATVGVQDADPPVFPPIASMFGSVGVLFLSPAIVVVDKPAGGPLTFVTSLLPPGILLAFALGNPVLVGTPTQRGAWRCWLEASDRAGIVSRSGAFDFVVL